MPRMPKYLKEEWAFFLFVYCIPFPALPLPKKAVDDFPHLVYHRRM